MPKTIVDMKLHELLSQEMIEFITLCGFSDNIEIDKDDNNICTEYIIKHKTKGINDWINEFIIFVFTSDGKTNIILDYGFGTTYFYSNDLKYFNDRFSFTPTNMFNEKRETLYEFIQKLYKDDIRENKINLILP